MVPKLCFTLLPAAAMDPTSGLVLDSSGNLYGVTAGGSISSYGVEGGCGSVFELSPDGTETTLHDFAGCASEGLQPGNTLTLYDGNLFGSARGGPYGYGHHFRSDVGQIQSPVNSAHVRISVAQEVRTQSGVNPCQSSIAGGSRSAPSSSHFYPLRRASRRTIARFLPAVGLIA